jgi:hypothetical protein
MARLDWELSTDIDNWETVLDQEFLTLLKNTGGSTQPPLIVKQEGAAATISAWKPREIRLHVQSPEGALLTLHRFYFPGWTGVLADMTGEGAVLKVQASEPDGLIETLVPPGSHDVLLHLDRSNPELAGQLISLVSLLVLLAFVCVHFVRRSGFRIRPSGFLAQNPI